MFRQFELLNGLRAHFLNAFSRKAGICGIYGGLFVSFVRINTNLDKPPLTGLLFKLLRIFGICELKFSFVSKLPRKT